MIAKSSIGLSGHVFLILLHNSPCHQIEFLIVGIFKLMFKKIHLIDSMELKQFFNVFLILSVHSNYVINC